MQSRIVTTLGTVVFSLLITEVAFSQTALGDASFRLRNQDVGVGYSISSINNLTLNNVRANVPRPIGSPNLTVTSSLTGPGSSRPTKPFANARPRSTVSPYLNLFNENLNDNADNYSALVRPMLNQQRQNQQFQRAGQQLQRQNQALNARFQQLSAQPSFAVQGNSNIFSTGHRTLFNNTSHYYPTRR